MSRSGSHGGATLALVAGAGALLWWLVRGGGRGVGHAGTHPEGSSPAPVPAAPCEVFIRAQRIDLDGSPAALSDVVARCRAAGRADVRATGDAVVRAIGDVVHALQNAGVEVIASPSVWSSANASHSMPAGAP